MMTPTPNRRGGFTLVELVLAIGVCSIVVTAIGGVFFSAVRLRESTARAVEDGLPLEQALVIVRRDLQGVMLTPSTNKVMSGNFRVGDITSFGLNQNVNLELYTTTGTLHDNEPWAEVQLVTYRLRDNTDRSAAGKDLVRSVTRNLLATMTPTPEEHSLLGNVSSLEIECYDGSQWRNTWDTTQQETNLPTAVRFRIQQANTTRTLQPIELVIPINVQTTTNDASSAESSTNASASAATP